MSDQPKPPVAARQPHEITVHGHTRVDDYFWMRDKDNPEVIAYIEAENDYTRAVMAHTEGLREKLYAEMVGRIQETDLTVPERRGDYFYYSRTEEGKQYNIYCRKHGSLEAEEEVLLDLNAMAEAEGLEYIQLTIYEISPDHRYLAYSLDKDGGEDFTLYVKDLESGENLPEEIPHTSWTAKWANDNRTLFYTTQDHAKRSYKLFRHVLGTPIEADEELYHEADEVFRVYILKTRDDAYLIRLSQSIESSENAVLPAGDPAGQLRLIEPRQKEMRYSVDHHSGTFYIVTNADGAKNFKVMTAPVDAPGKEKWETLIPHRPEIKIDDVDLFARHMVVYQREKGLQTMRISNLETNETHGVEFPEPAYAYRPADNPEFDTNLLRFTYTSLTTPDSVYDYDMETRERELKKRKPVLGGYDPADYRSERLMARAADGVQIPISLVYHRDTTPSPETPCLLYGYGSYGFSIDPFFDSNRISLLDRGMIYAIAHIRGGQEMGRQWYDDGKYLQKKNTFTDFIACAEHLIAKGYTSPERLAAWGGSAGGLLIGAVINMAPHLFHAAIASVPFVDVVTTMLDESIPLTVGEFEEWGNPKSEEYYHYMLSYSPYDNVRPQRYPHLLVTSGINDPRVQYWEPTKWTARLRTMKEGETRLLLRTNMGAGHGGASGRYDFLKERAFDYAFLLDTLGLGE